jgi:hypothetical protein
LPNASFVVAVICDAAPTTVLNGDGVTETVATGSKITVTVDDPTFPSLVAVMVVVPGTSPRTTPDCVTLATSGLLDAHATARSVTTVPLASLTTTARVAVSNTPTLTVPGVTVTVPTGTGVTVTFTVADFPSLVTVMTADPTATPVTTPACDTVAVPVWFEAHVTTRSVTTVPLASLTVATNAVV